MIEYLLEVTVCWVVLYGIFYLSMRRETFFVVNRFYLLSSLLLGLLLPMIHRLSDISFFVDSMEGDVEVIYLLQNARMNVASNVIANVPAFSTMAIEVLWMIYLAGVLFLLFQLCKGLVSIYRMYRDGKKERHLNYEVVWSEKPHLPFSFFNKIYVSKVTQIDRDFDRILMHELAHVKAKHSMDILLAEILTLIFWFHPMIYFYKTALRQTHEYLADDTVVRRGSRQLYGELLLRQSLSGLEMALVHQFFQSHIKKRINMIYQRRSGRNAWLKYALSIPILGALALSFTGRSAPGDPNLPLHEYAGDSGAHLVLADQSQMRKEGLGVSSSDSVPLFILDGLEVSEKEIEALDPNNIKAIQVLKGPKAEEQYPSRGLNGVVVIETKSVDDDGSFQFIEEDGDGVIRVADLVHEDRQEDAQVSSKKMALLFANSDSTPVVIVNGEEVGQEEIEVLSTDEIQTIEVMKGLKTGSEHGQKTGSRVIRLKSVDSIGDVPTSTPVYVINGERMPEGEIRDLSPDNVAEIKVLKGAKATSAIGKDGKGGVVIIRTKKDTSFLQLTQKTESTNVEKTIMIDGEEASELELQAIPSAQIRSISVLTGEHLKQQFPDVETGAVIRVTTSKGSKDPQEMAKKRKEHNSEKKIRGTVDGRNLEVSFEGSESPVSIQLHDIEGRLIEKPESYAGSELTNHSFDVSQLPTGIYVISAIQDNQIISEKISIVK